jgi:hypothetical protein
VLRAATYGRGVFEFTRPDAPAIAVNLESGLRFGTVCGSAYLTLQVFNVGANPLVITSVQRLMGSSGITVLPSPGTPLVVKAGEEIDFTIEFAPTTPGTPETATIRIVSNDPGAPVVDLMATGLGGVPSLQLAIADRGDFGKVCVGSLVDRGLVLNNRGPCPLRVAGVTSSSPDFIAPGVASFPLAVASGDSLELPIRFQPRNRGPASATITVTSDDPSGPKSIRVSGTAPAPRLVVALANAGEFGAVCIGALRDEPLTLSNSGHCELEICGISSSSPEFVVPGVDAYPIVIAPGDAVDVQVRFQPASLGPKSATLTIDSDDPGGPRAVAVSGTVPSGTLTITGTGHFGGVEFGHRAERTLSICNTGECDLHVTKVAFAPDPWEPGCHDCDRCDCHCGDKPHAHGSDQCCATFKIVGNPFPATVHPGACLGVVVRFVPDCFGAKCCKLVVESDDPANPAATVFVTGRLQRTLASALKCWAAEELQALWEAGRHC